MSVAKRSKSKPSPEEIFAIQALRKERKEKKELEQLAAANNGTLAVKSSLLARPWLTVSQPESSSTCRVRLLSWNLLAQCLVRRELFPTSDCLKVAQREHMIHEELSRQNADILCLQEVDRLEKLLPMLENAGYSHHYASGRGKQHGCLIAFKKTMYSLISSKVVFYDEENIGMDRTVNRLGGSFKTRNIGNLVALRSNANENEGVVIGTTHLFWHPCYTYERTRQTAILVRELLAFREKASNTWPCIIGGDFNFTPSDPAYSLLSGNDLLESQIDAIKPSLVVHASLDSRVLNNLPTVLSASAEEESEDADPDKVITNARLATAEDGLLTVSELSDWFSKLPSLHSAHDEGLKAARREGNVVPTYGDRISLPSERKGTCEPSYTSYTYYWQSVLDYIFFIDGVNRPVTVTGLLAPLHESDLVPGLPKKGISGSDHTCLVAELSW